MARQMTVPYEVDRTGKKRYWSSTRKRHLMAWLFMLPALIVLGIFVFYPIIYGIILSFFDYNIIEPPKFIGFANFTRAFKDEDFRNAVLHSTEYLLIVPLIQIAAIGLALLINSKLRGVKVFRFLYYLPVVTSFVVAAIVWRWIYEPNAGLLDSGYRWFAELRNGGVIHHFKGIDWLGDPRLALGAIAFVTFWKGIGYYMIIYLAGLQGIPKELEEAAKMDGATTWEVLRYITLPFLTPAIALCSILSTIAALRVFDEIFVLTGGVNGDPEKSTLVANVYIYGVAFGKTTGRFDFGYAAALSLLLAVVIWVFTLINMRVLNKGGMEY